MKFALKTIAASVVLTGTAASFAHVVLPPGPALAGSTYDAAFKDVPHVICYAIKANSNLAVIATLARAGAGADIVSGGELHRALRAGVPPRMAAR